jgi:hypothetical protein
MGTLSSDVWPDIKAKFMCMVITDRDDGACSLRASIHIQKSGRCSELAGMPYQRLSPAKTGLGSNRGENADV